MKPNLQLGELRPFGHTAVCGTRWDGFKDAADKAFSVMYDHSDQKTGKKCHTLTHKKKN